MFNLNKVRDERANITVDLIAKVIKELGHVFDVLSKFILQNKKDIRDLQARIKELEDKKWALNFAKDHCAILIEQRTG